MDTPEPDEQNFIDTGVAEIADSLFGEQPEEVVEDAPPEETTAPIVDAQSTPPEAPVAEAPVRAAPSSWAKETHEVWSKLPPEAQAQIEHREKQMLEGLTAYKEHNEFGKVMKEIMTPYKAIIAAQGLDEPKVVQVLMNAHYRLSNGNPQDKAQYLAQIARNYGIDIGGMQQAAPASTLPPEMQAALAKVEQFERDKQEHQQKQIAQAREKTNADVMAFADAKDEKGVPLHPYFDEVADDIVAFIAQGKTLEEAYKRAVRANPVTYEKETARLKAETETALRAKAKEEAEKARLATRTNVRGRDTRRAPTESLGTMEDTMKSTLAEIKVRTH